MSGVQNNIGENRESQVYAVCVLSNFMLVEVIYMELWSSGNRMDYGYGFGLPERGSETNVTLEVVRILS